MYLRNFHSLERQLVKESVLSLLNTNTFEEHVFTLVENYIYEFVQEYFEAGDSDIDQEEDIEIIYVWNEYLSDDEEAIDVGEAVKLKCQYTTRFQLEHGLYLSFHTNGELDSKVEYHNGQRHGRFQSWYINGQLCEEGQYIHDKRFGKWFMWNRNGNIQVEDFIVDVITHSHHEEYVYDGWRHVWFSNGQKEYEEFYVNGKRNGLSQQWDNQGFLLYQTELVNGEKHGVNKEWCRNGTLKLDVCYQHNVLHGLKRTWYEDGKLKSEQMYVSGKRHGSGKQWYESGQLRMTCSYLDDKLDGLQQAWTQNGELALSRTWDANNTDIDLRVFVNLFSHVLNNFFDN
jgi:antitoxin component YwqK of YwqJK toxin-antitoxin module